MHAKYIEGLAAGEARGEARGEAKGIEKVAINMLKANRSIHEISEFTGLMQDEIIRLKNKL